MQKLSHWPHLYRHRNGVLYYIRHVPFDVAGMVQESQFKRSLKHRDERSQDAKVAYDNIHAETETYITKLRRGNDVGEVRRDYEQAVARVNRFGFQFRSMSDLSQNADIGELIERLSIVEKKISDPANKDVDAILGAVAEPKFHITDALDRFIELSRNELRSKNSGQKRRWENPLRLAIQNFVSLFGDKPMQEITRDDALSFRDWWVNERIGVDVQTANAANKDIMHLRKIFRVVNDAHRLGLANPFEQLVITGDTKKKRVSIDRSQIENHLLSSPAFSGMNLEAQGIVRVMADTGARVNEVTGLEAHDIVLGHEVPHILVRPNAIRSLKTAHSERTIPLVGVALAALQTHPTGFPRYAGKNAAASAAINKHLRENELLPEGATLYGLRHGFQDRLIEIEAPERIQADLMGHKTIRPKYGKGPSLKQMQEWLLKTALHPLNIST